MKNRKMEFQHHHLNFKLLHHDLFRFFKENAHLLPYKDLPPTSTEKKIRDAESFECLLEYVREKYIDLMCSIDAWVKEKNKDAEQKAEITKLFSEQKIKVLLKLSAAENEKILIKIKNLNEETVRELGQVMGKEKRAAEVVK